MIATDRFVFLHLHKSGGTFVNECLLRHVPGARQLGYHKMADEIIELSDDTSYLDRTTASAIVQQRRLAVDSRRWLLSKVLPKVYGDRIEVSGDPEAPLVTRIELVPVAPIAIEARPVIEAEAPPHRSRGSHRRRR